MVCFCIIVGYLIVDLKVWKRRENRGCYDVSGGEEKKVGVGGMLGVNGDIVMIDEGLNGVDNKSREWFKDFVIDFMKGNKSILIWRDEEELLCVGDSEIIKLNDEDRILN